MQANATLSIVCCQLHNLWLGFSAEQINSASTSGINQKTFQLNQLLGLPPETTPARHQLSIKADNHLPDILVSSDIHLCELSLTDIHPLPPLLAARTTLPGLRALAWHQQRFILLFDARHLLAGQSQADSPA